MYLAPFEWARDMVPYKYLITILIIISDWLMKLARNRVDPSHFGTIKNSSAVQVLVDLVHDWSVARLRQHNGKGSVAGLPQGL